MNAKRIMLVSCLLSTVGGVAASRSIALQPIRLGSDTSASSSAAETVQVAAKGTGVTKAEALKDAYRDAVEKAVGQFVDAEQMMKNDEIITDQVLTQSNAYIEKFDLLKESEVNGLVKVFIKATVRKAELVKKISGVMPGVTVNVGPSLQNLHAQMTSKDARNADAAALVANVLKGLNPIKQLTTMSLLSAQPQVSESDCAKKLGPDKVRIGYLFKVEVDKDRYFKEYIPKLRQILGQVSLTPVRTIRLNENAESRNSPYVHYREEYLSAGPRFENELDACSGYTSGFSGFFDGGKFFSWADGNGSVGIKPVAGMDADVSGHNPLHTRGLSLDCVREDPHEYDYFKNGLEIVLMTELNAHGGKAEVYTVDKPVARTIQAWQTEFTGNSGSGKPQKLLYDVVFKDETGGEVAAFQWDLGATDRHPGLRGVDFGYARCWNSGFLRKPMRSPSRRGQQTGPECIWFVGPFVRGCAERYVEWHPFEFNKDDLPRIASLSIEIAE